MPISIAQRQAILTLLKDGLENRDIAAQTGVTPGAVAAVKAHVTMGSYGESLESPDAETEVASAVDMAFGLERDLQMALRSNLDQLETGLIVIDGGKEQTVSSGRIDIAARDKEGITVIIELKVGTADRDAVGQLLAYMGDLMEGATQIRGVLVARDFAQSATSAARVIPSIRLIRYGFNFTFAAVHDGRSARADSRHLSVAAVP